jgi:hypothetical protein
MNRMSDRKQARAMDLPDYPCPPSLGQIPNHAGSWGWFNTVGIPGRPVIGRDGDGYLWARSDARLSPERETRGAVPALAVWTEDGAALFVPREGYKHLRSIEGPVDELEWTPVASVLKEPPAYALNFTQS